MPNERIVKIHAGQPVPETLVVGCRPWIKILLKFNMSIYAKTHIQNKILILLLAISLWETCLNSGIITISPYEVYNSFLIIRKTFSAPYTWLATCWDLCRTTNTRDTGCWDLCRTTNTRDTGCWGLCRTTNTRDTGCWVLCRTTNTRDTGCWDLCRTTNTRAGYAFKTTQSLLKNI